MSLSLKDFSLLKEDNESYHVGHPKGKSMVIPKKGLSTLAQQLVEKLKREQNFADGTPDGTEEIAPEETEENKSNTAAESESATDSPESIAADAAAMAPTPNITAEVEQAAAQNVAPDSQTAQAPPPATPDGTAKTPLISNAGLETAKASIQTGVAAEEKASQQEAQAYGQAAKQISALKTPSQIEAEHNAKDLEFQSYLTSHPEDANRYINNMGIGSKISSGIAMILGGIGGGLTHQANPAVQYINNAIQRDIESQKADRSNVMNLWKMNREATGNDLSANLATQNQLLGIAKVKAMQAQAGAMGAQKQQQAAQLVLSINQQIAQGNRYRALMEAGPEGLASADPAQIVPMLTKDPGIQKIVNEEIGRAQNVSMNRQKMLNYFDQAAKDNTVLQTGAGLLRTPGSLLALHQTMLPNFKQIDGTVRQAAMDETHHNIDPQPGDTDAKVAIRRQALNDWMQSETAAPTAKGIGLDLQKFNSTRAFPNAQKPGSVVSVRGKQYKVASDGDTLTPL